MNREDTVHRYVYAMDDGTDKTRLNTLKELMLEMVPTDYHEKCNFCPIHVECYAPVTGVGNVNASIVFIGRNPGAEEDRSGLPFVGQGGALLDTFIKWVGLDRNHLYITNLVKCFTTGNRVPTQAEINVCMVKWLREELQLLQPKLLVTFGREACAAMTGYELKDARMKMTSYDHSTFLDGVKQISCTHPGAALRSAHYYKQFRDEASFVKVKCRELGLLQDPIAAPLVSSV